MPRTPEDIDAILPQTQCGLCGYGGCMPYAEALAFENAPINLCPPGGVKVLRALGELLHKDPIPHLAEMEKQEKPKSIAVIREAECIGCTKCIQACPVDAILGSAKQMHTVITDECSGCELCIPPCPVDCIDLLVSSQEKIAKSESDRYRARFNARASRSKEADMVKKMKAHEQTLIQKRKYIESALERAKAKKQGNR